jgi:ADP-ribose pyrophosphatase YjhB (NUDIX family)
MVVNKTMDKILFAFHNIYKSWSWVGGHCDGNPDMLEKAIEEAQEETGVLNITPFNNDILMIDTILVTNHIKRGHYVPDHLHLNATFLLVACEDDQVTSKPDENSGVRWFPIVTVLESVNEERMKVVYQKAFDKIETFRKSL